jgi:hypothetical protein
MKIRAMNSTWRSLIRAQALTKAEIKESTAWTGLDTAMTDLAETLVRVENRVKRVDSSMELVRMGNK